MKEITSSSNSFIKELMKLIQPRIARSENKFIIEGTDLLDLAYENHLLNTVLTCDGNLASIYEVETILVPKFILEKLSSNKSTPDIIGVASYPKEKDSYGDRLVYLDGVQDPGNVGTIIRTALAFCYDGVVLSSDSASIYNEKTIQSSKGAVFSIPLFINKDLKEFKDKNYDILVTALRNSIPYEEVNPKDKFVIVLGNEGQGVKQVNQDIATKIIKISMANIDSLNVSIAGGILMNHYKKL